MTIQNVAVYIAIGVMFAITPAFAGSYSFKALGSSDTIEANGLDDRDEVAGTIVQPGEGTSQGFIYANGSFAYVADPSNSTELDAINAKGVASGRSKGAQQSS